MEKDYTSEQLFDEGNVVYTVDMYFHRNDEQKD